MMKGQMAQEGAAQTPGVSVRGVRLPTLARERFLLAALVGMTRGAVFTGSVMMSLRRIIPLGGADLGGFYNQAGAARSST
jgi:hypothetical protein